jgi:hypothetical protein
MPKRPYIKFSVDEDLKKEIEQYAKIKGYDTGKILARVAIVSFMKRNPLKKSESYSASAVVAPTDIGGDHSENNT